MADLQGLIKAVVEIQDDDALEMTRELLAAGEDPKKIFEAYQLSMEKIGKLFERNHYFIPELLVAGELMTAASEIIKPHLGFDGSQSQAKPGKMILATVEGDIHDIGKNIAGMMCGLNDVEVIDLGVNVPADRIVAEVKASGADIVGLSGLLSLAFDPMKKVVAKLTAAGLRDTVKVIIGGGQMDERVRAYVGADAFANDAVTGVNCCKEWLRVGAQPAAIRPMVGLAPMRFPTLATNQPARRLAAKGPPSC